MGSLTEKEIKKILKEALNDYDRTCDNNPKDIDAIYNQKQYVIKDVTKECQHCYTYQGQCIVIEKRNEVGELIGNSKVYDVIIDYHWWAISSASIGFEIKDNKIVKVI